jgi:GNAT superfamily N-acetyltransferase
MFDIRSGASNTELYQEIPGFEISAEQLARQAPDEMLVATEAGTAAAARCGLWFRQTPALPGQRVGLVGHYFAADCEAGRTLLDVATSRLAQEGCTMAVGPMDGNTWQRYRLITDRGSEPPFFLEPDNPDEWPAHFRAAGFSPLAQYYSALTTQLAQRDPRSAAIDNRLTDRGIRVRPSLLTSCAHELPRIHELSLLSFANNFLYTPISRDDFVAQYAPLRPFLRPELILLAEQGDQLVGYVFAVPDVLQQQRGREIDTAIVKTIAVHPDHAGIGLGTYLVDRVHQAIHECGYRRAIHALFHEDNFSGKISRHTAHVIRQYTLFSRPLRALP